MYQLPPLDVVDPHGDRITVSGVTDSTTVASLAAALSTPRLAIDGRVLDGARRLATIDEMCVGARLNSAIPTGTQTTPSIPAAPSDAGWSPCTNSESTVDVAVVEVAVIAGPACTVWTPLGPGRHIIGRARHADLCVADRGLEPHHAIVDVDSDATVTFTQLAGAVPARVDGEVVAAATTIEAGAHLDLGTSVLEFRRQPDGAPTEASAGHGGVARHVSDPWRRTVWRTPDLDPPTEQRIIESPERSAEPAGPAATALIGAAVAALGAVLIATLMDNLMFLAFAGVGAVAAVATWLVNVIIAAKRRRRIRSDARDAVERFRIELRDAVDARRLQHAIAHPDLQHTLAAGGHAGGAVWSHRLAATQGGPANGNDGSTEVDAKPNGERSLSAVVGIGTGRWSPPVAGVDGDPVLTAAVEAASRLDRMVIPMTIAPGESIALHGPDATGSAVARSILVQLASRVGPADWRVVVVTARPRRWEWADWLPHGAAGSVAVIHAGRSDQLAEELAVVDTTRQLVVVTDEPSLFTTRTGPLRRLLSTSGASSIVVVDTDAIVPAVCHRVLHLGATGRARWVGDTPASDDAIDIRVAGITVEVADRAARRLACLVDPEDDGASATGLPSSLAFGELDDRHGVRTPHDVLAIWREGGPDPAPRAPIGRSADGVIDIDLVRDGPHGLIAGTTGSGKSELLRSLVLGLAVNVSPEHLNIVLVDYKGGSTFDACIDLPHTVGLVTDLDDGLAERALVSLAAELHRRERLLRSVGATDLTDYRTKPAVEPIARLVVVIDEFAALAKELPEFLAALVDIAQRGRSLGVHLLLATQRPAGVVNDDIRANTNLRLALRLHDRADAVDVVGDSLPASFPRGVPGRSALRLGPDELVMFQAARCTGPERTAAARGVVVRPHERRWSAGVNGDALADTDDDRDLIVDLSENHEHREDCDGAREVLDAERSTCPTELDSVVRCIRDAAAAASMPPAHRPWLEPLPFPLTDIDAALGDESPPPRTIGVVDDPEQQRRLPLEWSPSDGSLALVGSLGAGVTSTLISLAAATCSAHEPERLHLYVIDARGDDGLGALSGLAHCGGVVRLPEHERLHRLVVRLVELIDRRLAGAPDVDGNGDPDDVVLIIDGWSTVRTALGSVERSTLNELLGRVLSDGPGVGVVTITGDGATTSAAAMSTASDRWVFHLDDPAACRTFGTRVPVGPGRPGRLRIASSGREAQVAVGAPRLAEIASRDQHRGGPLAIEVLPDEVGLDTSSPRWRSSASATTATLRVGLGADDVAPDGPTVMAGDPLLIVGAARTGVTTALDACVAAWRSAHDAGDERIVRIDHRRGFDAELHLDAFGGPARRVLVVVDDAHRVDDTSGAFAALVRGDHPHVSLLIGARADAVRSGYGHWTRDAAKARTGIVMSSRGDPDGDVFGVTIPRRPLIAARPGLGWIIDGGPLRQLQVAGLVAQAAAL